MKGIIVDWIRAVSQTWVRSDSVIDYDETYSFTADLRDNSLITKAMMINYVGIAPPTPTNIVAGTDATPKIIAYSATSNPGYVLINLTGSPVKLIDNATNVTYDGTNFTIYGADNGSGKFIDSFVFIIKP